jgi:electron transfer flavoprotein beta subunit
MKILVCIKQVPGTTQVEIDETTGTLKRDGVAAKMNPYDLYALETALRIKSDCGENAEITAITMGPPQCERVIREAFMMGVDRGVILSDRAFGGADVLMTSYTLAQGVKKTGPYDIIICGKQTTDGDTAQVGAEMAEWLSIPHVANVKSIDKIGENAIDITVDMPESTLSERVSYPTLITVEKGIFEPRLPSYKLIKATADREITWLALKDLEDNDPAHYGLNGSPTQVKRIFPPESHVEHVNIEGSDAEKAAKLANILDERKFLR